MKKSVALLSASFTIAVAAAAYLGVSLHQERTARAALEENMRAQAADSASETERLGRDIKQFEAHISALTSHLDAAKTRATEREAELTALREKNTQLEVLEKQTRIRLDYEWAISKYAHYDTAEQILALPTCTLTDTQNHTCSVGFKDSAGRNFHIGGPGASREVAGFINSLEDGKTYVLPAAFIEYQKKNPPKPEPPAAAPPQAKPPELTKGEQF